MSDPQIYVRGYPRNCRESELKQLFSKFGTIKEVRIIRDYAFIVFSDKQQVEKAVRQMDGEKYQDARLRVEIAGKPRKSKGPQPNDECRYCRKLGHWQNNCPQYRDRRSSRRRHRSYSSSSSSSSSSESDRSRRRRRSRKVKKSSRKRSYSSSSSSSSVSSSSHSSSGERQNNRREKSKEDVKDVEK